MRISDWSSDVCSSDLLYEKMHSIHRATYYCMRWRRAAGGRRPAGGGGGYRPRADRDAQQRASGENQRFRSFRRAPARSEEHTSELQSLMRISYAVFCLKKKTIKQLNNCKLSTHTI